MINVKKGNSIYNKLDTEIANEEIESKDVYENVW